MTPMLLAALAVTLPPCPPIEAYSDACWFTVGDRESVTTLTDPLPSGNSRVIVDVADMDGASRAQCTFTVSPCEELATLWCAAGTASVYRAGVRQL